MILPIEIICDEYQNFMEDSRMGMASMQRGVSSNRYNYNSGSPSLNLYKIYESEKKHLQRLGLSSIEYESRITLLAKRLEI